MYIALYRLVFPFFLLFASPFYLARMLKRGGYAKGFMNRFGIYDPLPPRKDGIKRVWIHAVSVGEVGAILPLARLLKENGLELFITTTTSTGFQILQRNLAPLCVGIGYFALDFLPCVRAAWASIRADMLILAEGELWPEHLSHARSMKLPTVVINSRLSDRSFNRYLRAGPLARWLFSLPTHVIASASQDAERIAFFRLKPVPFYGNLKADISVNLSPDEGTRNALRAEWGFAPESLVIVGCSTWPGEELALVKAVASLRSRALPASQKRDVRLLIVPRHMERRSEILRDVQSCGLPFHLRTQSRQAADGTLVYIADTTGEMLHLMLAADIAVIGKSFPPHNGGQTPIEAVALGLAVLHGPEMSNFRSIAEELDRLEIAERVASYEELEKRLAFWVDAPPEFRLERSQRARAFHLASRGATRATCKAVMSLLEEPETPQPGGVTKG